MGSGGLLRLRDIGCSFAASMAEAPDVPALLDAAAPASVRVRRGGSSWWPAERELAESWEKDEKVRATFRQLNCHLLCWPDPKLVGVASMKALAMNLTVVKHALQIWGTSLDYPKAMSIDYLKVEVGSCNLRTFSEIMCPTPEYINII